MEVMIAGTTVEIDGERVEEPELEARQQLEEYLAGDRERFDLAIDYPDGFLGEVMREIRSIPHGQTRTYSELAAELDTAPVAVGQSCGRNPVPVIVPCHRVVGKEGRGGYRYGESVKKRLLSHENPNLF